MTEADTPLWLRLDEDDKELSNYSALQLPPSWQVKIGPRQPLSSIYEEAYRKNFLRLWWGFIADDVVPETIGWDLALTAVAGSDGMAVPAGGHEAQGTPHFVLGGDLVRQTGWLALPGLDRLYIDTVWADIARARNVLRYVPGVVLSHRHFSNRMARYDDTYVKRNRLRDRTYYLRWRREAFNTTSKITEEL